MLVVGTIMAAAYVVQEGTEFAERVRDGAEGMKRRAEEIGKQVKRGGDVHEGDHAKRQRLDDTDDDGPGGTAS